jgi:phage terminase small subunit
MPKKRDINKVKAVSKEYLNNGLDMSKALKDTGDKLTGTALSVKAHRWRWCPEIQAEIKAELALFDEKIVDRVYCLANLYEIVNDKMVKTSDRVNAINTLGKLIGIASEGQQVNVSFNLHDLKTKLQSIPVKSTS